MTYYKWLCDLFDIELELIGHLNNLSRETCELEYLMWRIA